MTQRDDDLRPWQRLPRIESPVALRPAVDTIDDLADLPDGSAATLAEILPDGTVHAAAWRHTGDAGFYPASSVKWITAFMTLDRLARHGLSVDDVLAVEGERPRTFRDLLGAMVVHSDNPAFNLLQETVGFRETCEQIRTWGCRRTTIRRHFTRPHYSHSRAARVYGPGGDVRLSIAARPDPQLPLNTDDRPPPLGNREQNLATTDDLVRIMAATLAGPSRDLPAFDLLTGMLGVTNQCDVREGLARLTVEDASRPAFTVLNKPGWWPPDQANVDMSYIQDREQDRHLLLAVYIRADRRRARRATQRAAHHLIRAIRRGDRRLAPSPENPCPRESARTPCRNVHQGR